MKRLENRTVLIVDDEAELIEILKDTFDDEGARTFTAANGNEAFSILEQNQIDVIISDIRMPGGDGVELTERIRAIKVEVPIIFLVSGYTDVPTEELYRKGANALFHKPYDIEKLVSSVSDALKNPNLKWTRKFERKATDLRSEVSEVDAKHKYTGRTLNLSLGGAFVAISPPIPTQGTELNFSFSLPNDVVNLRAFCKWHRTENSPNMPSGIGLEFISTPPETKTALKLFLDSV